MKKYSKLMAIILAVAMVLPGVAQATAPVAKAAQEDNAIRLSGDSRVGTALEASEEAYPKKANTVVIAGSGSEVDALAGTILANDKDAPLLLSGKKELRKDVLAKIKKLGAKKVYILGGEKAVPKKVATQLKDLDVIRVDGKNRNETAVKVAKLVKGNSVDKIFLASGADSNLSDALAIGPVSAMEETPVLLTNVNRVPKTTMDAIKALGVKEVVVIGGEKIITQNVVKELGNKFKERVSGSNRYNTAISIAKKYFTSPEKAVVANGYKIADALVGGYLGGMNDAPILLVNTDLISDNTKIYLKDNTSFAYVLGGEKVVNKKVYNQILEVVSEKLVKPVDKTILTNLIKTVEYVEVSIDGSDIKPTDKWTDKNTKKSLEGAVKEAQKVLKGKEFDFSVDKGKILELEMPFNYLTNGGQWTVEDETILKINTQGISFISDSSGSRQVFYVEALGVKQGYTNLNFVNSSGGVIDSPIIKVIDEALPEVTQEEVDVAVIILEEAIQTYKYAQNPGTKEDLKAVVKTVERAEKTKTQEDVNSAKKLVEKLVEGEAKKELEDRLDSVQDIIDEAKTKEENKAAAEEVVKMIKALPLTKDMTLADKDAIEETRAAYGALSDEAKELVTNLNGLENREDALAKLEKEQIAKEEAIAAAEEAIEALPTVNDLNLNDKSVVEAAREAYDELTANEKKLVNNIDKLKAAEDKIVELEQNADLTEYNAALKAVNEEYYTEASWTAYEAVVAENVVTVENTQDEVYAATAAIIAAQKDLVEVEEKPNQPDSIEIIESIIIEKNEVYNVKPILFPENTFTNYRWESSDYGIANVNSAGFGTSGHIVGVSPGEAFITVYSDNGLSSTCHVVVRDSSNPTEIIIPSSHTMYKGEEWNIPINLYPIGSRALFNIRSSDYDIIDAKTTAGHTGCKVIALKPGVVTVTIYTNTGLSETCQITIYDVP